MFLITHLNGAMEHVDDLARIEQVIDELAEADAEHPDVTVEIASGLGIRVDASGRMVIDNIEDHSPPRHLFAARREEMLAILRALVTGDLDTVDRAAWQAGYGP